MTVAAQRHVSWSDLVRHSGLDQCDWHVAGSFQMGEANYSVGFYTERELTRFLEFLFAAPGKPATSRLYRRASIHPWKPDYDLSNLRFQFDPGHQVAAAVVLVDDHQADRVSTWMTTGNAGRSGVVLAHDSWNEHETLFPPESFITLSELRSAVVEWAFGDALPPPAVKWVDAPGVHWF